MTMKKQDIITLNCLAQRAHFLLNQMIYLANHRDNQEKGDPKVGGHCSASTSALHILGALHLVVKTGYDHIVNKPHAAPTDHAYNYLLNLLLDSNNQPLSSSDKQEVMKSLRAFNPKNKSNTFQSYHSIYDPDHYNFLPSGTVGIPPVVIGYLALAYQFATLQGYKIPPKAHFWACIGDSEFREGSLLEAAPDLAEREVGNLTWIIDYNRQSLDGHRLVNENIFKSSDAKRIEKTLSANGWEVIQLQHGSLRQQAFQKRGGKEFQYVLENQLGDGEFQSLLIQPGSVIRSHLAKQKKLKTFLETINDTDLKKVFKDVGGHDFTTLIAAMEKTKIDTQRPSCIIAHTIKGWGLNMEGLGGNHSSIVSKTELDIMRKNIPEKGDFPLFEKKSIPNVFLENRRKQLYTEMINQEKIKQTNQAQFKQKLKDKWSPSLSIDFQRMSYPHTQWMLGQMTTKLSRIANTKNTDSLSPDEQQLQPSSQLVYTLSPDVGSSTNLGSSMNNKVFGPYLIKELSMQQALEDKKSPNIISRQEKKNRFLRFEITEGNSISCMAALGKIRDILGIPLLPIMTIYDFFIKRALDQYFYSLYWHSSFILLGTPSGVTLSPEGAQHGWKSDFQIPNQITWEPFFLIEMDWIFTDALQRHFEWNNQDRAGVLIRAVTRGVEQKQLLQCLHTQGRFKKRKNIKLSPKNHPLPAIQNESEEPCIPETQILEQMRQEVLNGAYYLLDYRAYADYIETDNVVHLFAMGAPSTSAIKASQELLNQGIYANLIIVTSPDLLLGNLAYQNNYHHLKKGLQCENILSPLISIHDGEPGLLDNIGSILGLHHTSLAVRKHSLCGRPSDIYQYHSIDKDSIIEKCLEVLHQQTQKHFAIKNTLD